MVIMNKQHNVKNYIPYFATKVLVYSRKVVMGGDYFRVPF